jgi:cytochrome c-type biogenesis protein CcmH
VKRAIALIALALLLLPIAASAACPKTSLADIEDEVMCPVCGVPLQLATEAPQANRERAFIQREVESCKSKQEIKDELVAQFGDRVLALPPGKGFNVAAYIAPAAAVVLGLAVITVLVLRRRRDGGVVKSNGAGPAAPALAGEDAARLEADIGRYEL